MHDTFSAQFVLPNEEDTASFGACLAPFLAAGDTVLLSGQIGAGKTQLARSIIQARLAACGREEDIPSPTYTLVQTYSAGDVEIWHADLYRLSDAQEVFELGLEDAFESAIVLVEWPEKLGVAAPLDALKARLTVEGEGRRITLASRSARWLRISGCMEPAV